LLDKKQPKKGNVKMPAGPAPSKVALTKTARSMAAGKKKEKTTQKKVWEFF
jgi:hypothetical protein